MKTLAQIAHHYQSRFGYSRNFTIAAPPSAYLRLCVVIPAFDEEQEKTLASLAKNSVEAPEVEIILVLNHSEKAGEAVKKKHKQQALALPGALPGNGIKVHVISTFDLPAKQAGVGLARKIGMDVALQRFATAGRDGLVVCLDADCTVSNNYLHELLKAEEQKKVSGLSINFAHSIEEIENALERQRITEYETWLRYYVQALRHAGYPHAFHTIGSSMAVRASAYARIGGMNRRKAGEDFYFLHKLIPHGQFYDLTTCTVFPSARISERVPFGTGRAMLEMEAGEKDFCKVYHPQIFQELGKWLAMRDAIFEFHTAHWPGFIAEFADQNNWKNELEAIQKRSTNSAILWRNFQFWLDGFRVLKLVHFARDHYYENEEAIEASARLLGIEATEPLQLLMKLRQLDCDPPFAIFRS